MSSRGPDRVQRAVRKKTWIKEVEKGLSRRGLCLVHTIETAPDSIHSDVLAPRLDPLRLRLEMSKTSVTPSKLTPADEWVKKRCRMLIECGMSAMCHLKESRRKEEIQWWPVINPTRDATHTVHPNLNTHYGIYGDLRWPADEPVCVLSLPVKSGTGYRRNGKLRDPGECPNKEHRFCVHAGAVVPTVGAVTRRTRSIYENLKKRCEGTANPLWILVFWATWMHSTLRMLDKEIEQLHLSTDKQSPCEPGYDSTIRTTIGVQEGHLLDLKQHRGQGWAD